MSELLKVASTSNPSATAGALANTIRENGKAELQAIGPKAVNQMIKAIAIARGYMAPSGVDLVFIPSFVDVQIDDGMKTALRLKVKTRLPYKPEKGEKEKRGEPKDKEEQEKKEKPQEKEPLEENLEENTEEEDEETDILDF